MWIRIKGALMWEFDRKPTNLFDLDDFSTYMSSTVDDRSGTGGVLLKKVFLEISQNSQENTCARVSFLIKLQARPKACTIIKKETLA